MTLQIVECNALPTLILMLRSEDAAIHYEAVGLFHYIYFVGLGLYYLELGACHSFYFQHG